MHTAIVPKMRHASFVKLSFNMTEQSFDPCVIPVPIRFCQTCNKRLAAMNKGAHCFACDEKILAKRLCALNTYSVPIKPAPRVRVRKVPGPIRAILVQMLNMQELKPASASDAA